MEQELQSGCQQDTNKMKEGLQYFFVQDDLEVPSVPREVAEVSITLVLHMLSVSTHIFITLIMTQGMF